MDNAGRLRIAAQWDDASPFPSSGATLLARVGKHLAPVQVEYRDNGETRIETYDTMRYGYIDRFGKEVIPLKYSDAGDFAEGLARVKDPQTKLWGFIDTTGQLIIDSKFHEVGDFCCERAMVRFEKDGKLGFLDKTGELAIPCSFDGPAISRFTSEGLAWVRVRDPNTRTEMDGYIGVDGTWAIPPEYELCQNFYEGLACVRRTLKEPWIFIDTKGNEVFDTGAEDCHAFSEGTAAVQTVFSRGKDCEWRYVDKTGKAVPGLEHLYYLRCGVFRSGVAWVCDHRHEWGIIDRTGKVVLKPGTVQGVGRFENGLAMVEVGEEKVGYIDNKGKWIRKPL